MWRPAEYDSLCLAANNFVMGRSKRSKSRQRLQELEAATRRRKIWRFQLIDAASFVILLAFVNVIILVPSASSRWQNAPTYVRGVYYAAIFILGGIHLIQGPYRGSTANQKAYIRYYRIQVVNHALQAAFATYAFLWLLRFNEFATPFISAALKSSQRVGNIASNFLQVIISGVIGNFAYDLMKRTLRKTTSATVKKP